MVSRPWEAKGLVLGHSGKMDTKPVAIFLTMTWLLLDQKVSRSSFQLQHFLVLWLSKYGEGGSPTIHIKEQVTVVGKKSSVLQETVQNPLQRCPTPELRSVDIFPPSSFCHWLRTAPVRIHFCLPWGYMGNHTWAKHVPRPRVSPHADSCRNSQEHVNSMSAKAIWTGDRQYSWHSCY